MPIAFAFRHFNGYDMTWRGVLACPHEGRVIWMQARVADQTKAQAIQAARFLSTSIHYLKEAA